MEKCRNSLLLITNKEIQKSYPQIKYFINSWNSGKFDRMRIDTLCNEGIKHECQMLAFREDKKAVINTYQKYLFKYIEKQLFSWKNCNCLIWRERPRLIKEDSRYAVYSRLTVTYLDIEHE